MSTRFPDTAARSRPENLGVLLREPFLAANEDLHRHFAERGHPEIRPPHGNVFPFLDDGGTRVSELARRAQVTKQSMAELVAHLERHGYVERVPDPKDRRAKLVRSTTRGDELYALAREFVVATEADWERKLGKAKMRQLRQLLVELNAAI
jgi:DNA-binding MarR family transcriptional regulator